MVGAFQRCVAHDDVRPCVRRISGGAPVEVGPGTLHVVLALEHPAAVVPCDAARLINRHVRPLLSALTKLGQKANYFGRDWISVTKRPVAAVGFAHDARSGRSAFEAFVAASTPFVTGARRQRISFQGKEPITLEEALGRAIDLDALAERVVHAYTEAYGCTRVDLAPWGAGCAPGTEHDPPWAATVAEVIGEIGAGPDAQGIFRVGGDFLASRDAVARLERNVAELRASAHGVDVNAVQECVVAAFTAQGVALDGVRSPTSMTDAIVRALALQ